MIGTNEFVTTTMATGNLGAVVTADIGKGFELLVFLADNDPGFLRCAAGNKVARVREGLTSAHGQPLFAEYLMPFALVIALFKIPGSRWCVRLLNRCFGVKIIHLLFVLWGALLWGKDLLLFLSLRGLGDRIALRGRGMAKKTTWLEKLHDAKDNPKVKPIPAKMQKRWGKGSMLIPAPLEVDAVMASVRTLCVKNR